MSTIDSAKIARDASLILASIATEKKNLALECIITELQANKSEIFSANQQDLELAKQENLSAPALKRLTFNDSKLASLLEGLHSLINLPEPVGQTLSATELDEGLELYKVTCPIGVIGVIFESRPDALVQISSLCLKSGNSVLLKGGREALRTNRALAQAITRATEKVGIPGGWLQLLETREEVAEMLKLEEYIDLIIPRGSNAFVKYIMENSAIPVMGHADGLCHVYIDDEADIDMAIRIAVDSKTQYVSVCNAAETFLVGRQIAAAILPKLAEALRSKNVRILGCPLTQSIIACEAATEEDWSTEYLDYVISIKIVDSLDEAINHINKYGSGHTDVIVTQSAARAERFQNTVDSADVFWNCSSRFADGFRYGLGAEVGISTNKIHARGPVGLEGLVIYKWKLQGHGQIVDDYATGKRNFTHKKIK